MKKLLVSLLILAAGTAAFGRLLQVARTARVARQTSEAEWLLVSNRISELTEARSGLVEEIKSAKVRFQDASSASEPEISADLLELVRTNGTKDWPSYAAAELRSALGLVWSNSPDYVLVSKASLKQVSLNGVAGDGTLTSTICEVLALAPEERAGLEALVRAAETEYAAWAKANVKRIEPSVDVVAQYEIPANPSLAQRLSFEGGMGVLGLLGPERTAFSRQFATEWVQKQAFLGQAQVSLTVRRSTQNGRTNLQAKCDNLLGGGISSSGWSELTASSFPGAFRSIFPGGWNELAQREGFGLPETLNPTIR